MKTDKYPLYFIYIGLISLLFGLLCGLLAGFQYIIPSFIKEILPFNALRPLHTLFVVSWILLSAIGGIYYYIKPKKSTSYKSSFLAVCFHRNWNNFFLFIKEFRWKRIFRVSKLFLLSNCSRVDFIWHQLL
jgi:nitric oxide reductase large subunit